MCSSFAGTRGYPYIKVTGADILTALNAKQIFASPYSICMNLTDDLFFCSMFVFGLFRVYHAARSVSAGIGSSTPETLEKTSGWNDGCMDGWMEISFWSMLANE